MTWVRGRRAGKQMAHYSEAPEPLGSWPDVPEGAEDSARTIGFCRRYGRPYLEWKRPASSQLDPNRRLLATGRYADEEQAAAPKAARNKAARNKAARPTKRKQKGADAASTPKRRSTRQSTKSTVTGKA